MKFTRFILLALSLLVTSLAIAQEPPSLPGKGMKDVSQDEIKPLTTVCESCHGTSGQSTRKNVPSIAGKSPELIMASLEQFYFGERHCPDVQFENKQGVVETKNMCDITDMLTKPEGLALAEYFSNQEAAPEVTKN